MSELPLDEAQIDAMLERSNDIRNALHACLEDMDPSTYHWRELVAGVMRFAVEAFGYCYYRMGPIPISPDVIIATFGRALREALNVVDAMEEQDQEDQA